MFSIYLCKNLTYHYCPNLSPGIIIWKTKQKTWIFTIWSRMLLYKFKIFWPDGSREKNISNYFPLLIFVWKLDTSPMWPNSTCELNKFKYNQPEEALTQILVVFKNVSLYMPLQKFKLPFWSNLPQEIILLYKLKYKIPTCKDAHKFKLFFWPMGFENILKFCST